MLKTITSFVDSLGSLTYKGLWNAATNTPTLASGVGTTGDYYVVSVPGTTTLDGISSWAAGDWAIFNGSVWEKYNNPADTLGEVLANGNTTAGTDISVTTGDDITFADNSKAIFGDGSDLQIYHNGSNSFIDDAGTGNLQIRGTQIKLQKYTGENMFVGISDGAASMYYDNSQKIATTATGIDVTGSVTADGLTVDASTSSMITLNHSTASNLTTIGQDSSGDFRVRSDNVNKLKSYANGDFELYEDTGTTPKFFWDASAESLGIGTTTPSEIFEVSTATANTAYLKVGTIANSSSHTVDSDIAGVEFYSGDTSGAGAGVKGSIRYKYGSASGATTNMTFHTADVSGSNDVERLRIDASGNLLVGKTAPTISTTGVELRPNGQVFATQSGNYSLLLNRTTSDGDIVQFRKDNTAVGSIGVASSRVYIGTDDTGLRFTNDEITPFNPSVSADRNGTVDLGGSSTRFKDLYLSGGVNLANDSHIQFSSSACRIEGTSSGADYIKFITNSSEGFRLDSSGNLLVGKTSVSFGTAGIELKNSNVISITRSANPCLNANRIGSSAGSLIIMHYDGVDVGSIDVTASATSYTTSSDQRLKENIADADDAGSKIDAIQVRKFDWKVDGSHQDYGMVAQELLEVAPEAVSQGETEDDMMGVDYSKLVPMMLKEIQSLRARVATLEGNPPQETTTTERVIV